MLVTSSSVHLRVNRWILAMATKIESIRIYLLISFASEFKKHTHMNTYLIVDKREHPHPIRPPFLFGSGANRSVRFGRSENSFDFHHHLVEGVNEFIEKVLNLADVRAIRIRIGVEFAHWISL